jgi:glutamine amidotransferase-like uncharacterized protein
MERRMTLVYAGEGSSHSWTWLADLFEAKGVHDVRFLDSKGFTEGLNDDVRTAIISGGDGLKIASSLGAHGFAHLKGFIHKGGTYVGICAGAYLPLPSLIEPLNRFNLSSTKIENIDCSVMSGSPRVSVRYGSCSIVHPVRGEVDLEGIYTLKAPLYGGPIFKEPEHDETLLRYRQFTGSTEFQMDKARATSMVLGKPAALRVKHGLGELLLLGPHLEHPRYPGANDIFMRLPTAGYGVGVISEPNCAEPEKADPALLRSLADLKVSILGLENRSFLVGNKLWDGSRFLELIVATEKRAHTLDHSLAIDIKSSLDHMRELLVNSSYRSFEDSLDGPDLLVEAARKCADNHFAYLRGNR